jgi:transposase-like protein
MEKLPRQVYTSEFRRQAVGMVFREGLGIAEASRRLSLSPKTLTNWVRRAKGGSAAEVADAAPRREVTEYIDLFYNRQRRQARLGYLSPAAYTQLFTRQQRAA